MLAKQYLVIQYLLLMISSKRYSSPMMKRITKIFRKHSTKFWKSLRIDDKGHYL